MWIFHKILLLHTACHTPHTACHMPHTVCHILHSIHSHFMPHATWYTLYATNHMSHTALLHGIHCVPQTTCHTLFSTHHTLYATLHATHTASAYHTAHTTLHDTHCVTHATCHTLHATCCMPHVTLCILHTAHCNTPHAAHVTQDIKHYPGFVDKCMRFFCWQLWLNQTRQKAGRNAREKRRKPRASCQTLTSASEFLSCLNIQTPGCTLSLQFCHLSASEIVLKSEQEGFCFLGFFLYAIVVVVEEGGSVLKVVLTYCAKGVYLLFYCSCPCF